MYEGATTKARVDENKAFNVEKEVLGMALNLSIVDYDVKLIWRQQRNDIVRLAAICATMVEFLFWSYSTCCVASLRA